MDENVTECLDYVRLYISNINLGLDYSFKTAPVMWLSIFYKYTSVTGTIKMWLWIVTMSGVFVIS